MVIKDREELVKDLVQAAKSFIEAFGLADPKSNDPATKAFKKMRALIKKLD